MPHELALKPRRRTLTPVDEKRLMGQGRGATTEQV
jgi:hypothetical protein